MIGHHCKLSPLVRRGCRKTCGLCKPTMSPSPSPSASPSPSPSPSPAPLSGWLEPRPGRKQLRLQVTLGLDMGEHREVARAVELALRDALGLPWHNLRATVVKIRAGSLLVVFDISTDDQDEPTDETPLGAALRLACMLASLEAGQGGLLDATEVGRSVVAAAGVQRVHADGTLRQLVCQQPESACFDAGALDFPAEACRGLAVDHHCVLSPLVLRACSQSCELCAAEAAPPAPPPPPCADEGAREFPATACSGLSAHHHCVVSPLVRRACRLSCAVCSGASSAAEDVDADAGAPPLPSPSASPSPSPSASPSPSPSPVGLAPATYGCLDRGAEDFPPSTCIDLSRDHHCAVSPLVLRACELSCGLCELPPPHPT